MYDPALVEPMRSELTNLGVKELRTPEDVADHFTGHQGTSLLVINSVCGCAAGGARPSVGIAVQNETKPDHIVTVFAGQDGDATQAARQFIGDLPPSSPCFALFKDGEVVQFVPRHMIEGQPPQAIAFELVKGFDEHCSKG